MSPEIVPRTDEPGFIVPRDPRLLNWTKWLEGTLIVPLKEEPMCSILGKQNNIIIGKKKAVHDKGTRGIKIHTFCNNS